MHVLRLCGRKYRHGNGGKVSSNKKDKEVQASGFFEPANRTVKSRLLVEENSGIVA